MDYDCQTIPVDKLLINPQGTQRPLCNDCKAPDCTNPIRDRIVSVIGVPTKMRLWVVNLMVRQVVACKGYMSGDRDVAMGLLSPTPDSGNDHSTPLTVRGNNSKSESRDQASQNDIEIN